MYVFATTAQLIHFFCCKTRLPPLATAAPNMPSQVEPIAAARAPLSKRAVQPAASSKDSAVVAAKDAAAARTREGARQHRRTAVDPVRERVRAEMRAEAAAAKAKAQIKIDEIEAREEAARNEQLERDELRQEARTELRRNLREIAAEEADEDATTAFSAEAAPAEPGHAERVQLIMQDRAARIRGDTDDVKAFRDRVAARKFDPGRFGPATASSAPAVDRSLFSWAPPTDVAPPPAAAAPPVVRSEAAQSAWEWINRAGPPPATDAASEI